MKKYKSLILLYLLIFFWTLFFGMIQYFLRTWLGEKIDLTLQYITGCLSVGSLLAFLFGGALSYSFQERLILIIYSFVTLFCLILLYFVGYNSYLIVSLIIFVIGVFYGLRTVTKNVLLSTETLITGLSQNSIFSIMNIIFLSSLILGSVGGGYIYDKLGKSGISIMIGLMIISIILAYFLDYKQKKVRLRQERITYEYWLDKASKLNTSLKAYIPSLKIVVKKYLFILMGVGVVLTGGIALSQQVIQYCVDILGKDSTISISLMLFSSIGVVLGNVFSAFIDKKRWLFFIIFSLLFAIFSILFFMFNFNFSVLIGYIIFLGFLFGNLVVLLDSYYFHAIAIDDQKEYGSSIYGFITSSVIGVFMFVISGLQNYLGYYSVFVFIAVLMVINTILVIKNRK